MHINGSIVLIHFFKGDFLLNLFYFLWFDKGAFHTGYSSLSNLFWLFCTIVRRKLRVHVWKLLTVAHKVPLYFWDMFILALYVSMWLIKLGSWGSWCSHVKTLLRKLLLQFLLLILIRIHPDLELFRVRFTWIS